MSMSIRDRGFASMSRERQHELASKGGRAVHAKGTAHEWTVEEARQAGRKGMLAMARKWEEKAERESERLRIATSA
jgi:general stress protein YciG